MNGCDPNSADHSYNAIPENPRVKHYYLSSGAIPDTDGAVLEWIMKYCGMLKECEGSTIYVRVPLTIERGVKDFSGGTWATVYARFSSLPG